MLRAGKHGLRNFEVGLKEGNPKRQAKERVLKTNPTNHRGICLGLANVDLRNSGLTQEVAFRAACSAERPRERLRVTTETSLGQVQLDLGKMARESGRAKALKRVLRLLCFGTAPMSKISQSTVHLKNVPEKVTV